MEEKETNWQNVEDGVATCTYDKLLKKYNKGILILAKAIIHYNNVAKLLVPVTNEKERKKIINKLKT